MPSDTCVIVPAYREASVVGEVVRELTSAFAHVVVVDDASDDGTADVARAAGAVVLRHALNLGAGGALETGVRYALTLPGVEHFVTVDADGQHSVSDAVRLVEALQDGDCDVVLGSRFLVAASVRRIPLPRRLLLRAATVVNNRTSGISLTDAHCGLRAFGRPFAERLRFTMLDMAHASELTSILARSGLSYQEVPVTVRYTDYSRGKGQRGINAVNIICDVTLARFVGKSA